MIPLYTEEEFNKAKYTDKLKVSCIQCQQPFYISKERIKTYQKISASLRGSFCSASCRNNFFYKDDWKPPIVFNCDQCGKEVKQRYQQYKQYKNHFCGPSCRSKYTQSHKTWHSRRSKLEKYLENQIKLTYPNLNIIYNDRTMLSGLELDIYFPDLKLAIELNGPLHYEPIYGQDHLNHIQSKDQRKFQICFEHNIELCIIDNLRNFSTKFGETIFSQLKQIIDSKIERIKQNSI